MKHLTLISTLSVLGSVVVPSIGWTRQVEDWPYDRLFKEADLVVIARPVSSAPCQDQWNERFFEKSRFQGLETIFEIASTFKGETPKSLKLLYFHYKSGERPYEDGPGLVSFHTKPHSIHVSELGREESNELKPLRVSQTNAPEYLLFLKQRKDGRYEAISGQMDPKLSSRTVFQTEMGEEGE